LKFHELTIGQQFEIEGEVYVKTAPLVASHEQSGKQKFMARYVAVKLSGDTVPAAAVHSGESVRTEAVVLAFDEFYNRCLRELENLLPENQDAAHEALAEARKEFLDSLH
jgi:hypothetical protein